MRDTNYRHDAEAAQRVAHQAVGDHIAHKIKHGDPDVGWEGDPHLVLTYDEQDNYWRIWDAMHEPPTLVMRKFNTGAEFNTRSMCEKLRDASLQRQSLDDIMSRIDDHNEGVQAASDISRRESASELGEQLHWSLVKGMD